MNDHQNTPSDGMENTAPLNETVSESAEPPTASSNRHIEALANGIGPRPPGSDAEESAASYLATALGEIGMPAARLPSHHPKLSGLPEIAFALSSLIALLVAVILPPLGLLLLLGLLGLMLADLYGYVRVTDWLPSGTSINILSIVPPSESEVRRLIVTATLDTGQVGWLSSRHWSFAYAWLHAAILFAQGLGVLVTIVVLARGNDSLDALFAIPAVLLILTLILLGEREQSNVYSPGAITNASGIATLIDIAGQTINNPPRWLEVWFLGIGASNVSGGGITDFLKKNTFDPDITYFVHLQSPGGGPPTIPKVAGAGLRTSPATPLLTWIFDSVRGDLIGKDTRTVGRLPTATQSHATSRAGYQSIVIAGVDERNRIPFLDDPEDLPYKVRTESIDATVQFLSAAIDSLDREVAARAMLARSAASIQDTNETPIVSQDLPTGGE